jgi:hypothetical protein
VADDTVGNVPPGEQVVRPKRVAATVWDMVRSLGVMAVVVALTLVFVPGLLHPNKSQRFPAVTYSDDTEGFHQVTGQRALVPTGLAKLWYANSASLSHSGAHAHLHIGWVTPTNAYAALEESNDRSAPFIVAILGQRGATVAGTQDVNGVAWDRRVSARGENSLTRKIGAITVVITGSATTAQQEALAGSLA